MKAGVAGWECEGVGEAVYSGGRWQPRSWGQDWQGGTAAGGEVGGLSMFWVDTQGLGLGKTEP